MIMDMVQQRKLRGEVKRHFPHPFCHFGEKSLLQTNGLLGLVSVFGRFLAYQILPNFTNFYQKCVAKRGRRGSKRPLTRGFGRPIYLNRVKSGGSSQAVTWLQNRREQHGGLRVLRVEPGRRQGSSLELFRAQPALYGDEKVGVRASEGRGFSPAAPAPAQSVIGNTMGGLGGGAKAPPFRSPPSDLFGFGQASATWRG